MKYTFCWNNLEKEETIIVMSRKAALKTIKRFKKRLNMPTISLSTWAEKMSQRVFVSAMDIITKAATELNFCE